MSWLIAPQTFSVFGVHSRLGTLGLVVARLVAVDTNRFAIFARECDSAAIVTAIVTFAVAFVEPAALSPSPSVLLGYQLVHHSRVRFGIGGDPSSSSWSDTFQPSVRSKNSSVVAMQKSSVSAKCVGTVFVVCTMIRRACSFT